MSGQGIGEDLLAKAVNRVQAAERSAKWNWVGLFAWAGALCWAALALAQEVRYIRVDARRRENQSVGN